ncbi:MAG: type 1 glutamine amidotransferase [Acidimicrobiales bacterium]
MRALMLAHDPSPAGGMLGDRLRQRGIEVVEHVMCPDVERPDRSVPFPVLDGFDLLVPMGSVWSVYDDATIGSWIDDELDLIRSAHRDDRPVLGICFGGQALAAALGGSVSLSPVTEIGWIEVHTDKPADVPSGPWLGWHHDRFETPPGAEVIARNGAGPQLFRVARSVGTQFHPEVDLGILDAWLANATDEYLEEHGVDVETLRDATRANEAAARRRCDRLVDWFLDDVSGLGARLAT